MWLSKKHGVARTSGANLGTASIGGSRAAAVTDAEQRSLPLFAPGGYRWVPEAGEALLVIKCGEGGDYPVIAAGRCYPGEELSPGEVAIFSKGGAEIRLKNDGSVHIDGTLYINGEPAGGS